MYAENNILVGANENTEVSNPAFDIVESDLITGIITEEGIKKPF